MKKYFNKQSEPLITLIYVINYDCLNCDFFMILMINMIF